MKWNVKALSAETADTDMCLVVNFETAKYIFNCGEGTVRACTQRKQGLKYLKAMFMTRVKTDTTAGLTGFLMTVADWHNAKHLRLVGPPNLTHFLATARRYSRRDALKVEVTEYAPSVAHEGDEPPIFRDENLTVHAVPVLPEDNNSSSPSVSKGLKRKRDTIEEHIPRVQTFAFPNRSEVSRGSQPSQSSLTPSSSSEPFTFPKTSEISPRGSQPLQSSLTSSSSLEPSENKPGPFLVGPSATLLNYARSVRPRIEGAESDATRINAGDDAPLERALPADEQAHPGESDVSNVSEEEIMASWNVRGFVPSGLTGRQADLWRRKTVEAMYPGNDGAVHDDAIFDEDETASVPFSNPLKVKILHDLSRSPNLPRTARLPYALSYVCIGPQLRGKFLAAKAEVLGVPSGPLRGALTRGETVTLRNGNVITPEMCMDPPRPPTVFYVVDCPSPAYISGLTAAPGFDRHRPGREIVVRTIFHRVGAGVLEDARYQEWMNSFGSDVHHLIANSQYSPNDVAFTSAAYTQLRLATLDPEAFAIPKYSLSPSKSLADLPSLPSNTIPLCVDHLIDMNPPVAPVVTHVLKDYFHPAITPDSSGLTEPVLHPNVSDVLERVRRTIQRKSASGVQPRVGDDVVVTALGTGSAMPSKYLSATLIQMPKRGSILLDAGESTWGQMSRQFGVEDGSRNVYSVLRDLRCIFISHIHGDHHMGLSRILSMRRRLNPHPTEPIYLIADWITLRYLSEYQEIEDLGLNDQDCGVRTIQTEHIVDPSISDAPPVPDPTESQTKLAELSNELGMLSILTVPVRHRVKCHGIVMRRVDSWSFAYSGDTMPSNNLIDTGKGVRLLIHEATLADNQEEEAKAKAHSTFGQAIAVGQRMEAEITYLTHFSQRFHKVSYRHEPSPFRHEPSSPGGTVPLASFRSIIAVACDHLSLRIGEMWKSRDFTDGIYAVVEEDQNLGDDEELPVPVEEEVRWKPKITGKLGSKRGKSKA